MRSADISRFVKQLHRVGDVLRKPILDRAEGRDFRGREGEEEKTPMHHLIERKPNRRRKRSRRGRGLGKIKVVTL